LVHAQQIPWHRSPFEGCRPSSGYARSLPYLCRTGQAQIDRVQWIAMANAVEFHNVCLAFDDHVVLNDLSFAVPDGSMRILLGASGAGKSLVLKLILGLLRPDSGTIVVNGNRVTEMAEAQLLAMRADVGMVFQENALFDSLTVAENVGFRLYEATD